MYNLLLVDDEPLIKVAFQSAVEWGKNGFLLAATASNGQEALHIVETQHIDAVITDLKMPGMDGLALIHELKKRSFIGPILVLSNYSDFDSVRAALTDGAYDYFLKINMNGESIGEHLEKMADLLRVQQQRQTEEDHRSFAIEAQKKENALIHCAQWVTSTAEPSPASNPFSMLPEPLSFPIRLFTVTLIPAKTHPMPALDAVTDLITEVFDEISGKVFLHTHEDEICGLISNESLVASGRTLDKKLTRLQRHKMRKDYIIKDARRILAEQIRDNGMNTMNKNPITNATGLSAIIPKDNDGYCTVYKMDCEDGLGLMTVYQVYPGIQLIYNDFEATSCYWDGTIDKNVLEINHCREGREGSVLQSGSCLYLGEGDLSIHTMDNCASEMAFPLRHYRGISVVLDLELVSQNPPGILAESGIGIADFKNKFCADGACFVMRAKDEIEHIFSELYSVPDCLQKPYFMLKVQELLLFLCMVDVNKEKQRELYTSPQVEIVRDIHKRLISNLQERPTIEELSKEYLINTATLKDTFKGVYGQPIGTYMKVYRMKQAAALLRQTQATIAEIASQVGYENQSKFATAFRDVMKIAPAEYRKQNSGD